MTKEEIRNFMIDEMVDVGELIPKGEFYEDMGGHLSHKSQLDGHIKSYFYNMPEAERNELIKRIQG